QMLAAGGVKDVESDADRAERLAALGNPTLRSRRDLTRAFAAGCAAAELSGGPSAESSSVDRFLSGRERASGLSFAALAADLAGASFARRVQSEPDLIARLREKFAAADGVPSTDGLRD